MGVYDMAAALTGMSVTALNKLYEDLWLAVGPKKLAGKAAARRAVARALRAADAIRIRTIVDPLEAPETGGLGEASKRFKLYRDGESVADFVLRHGDGAHLRLDVQRGNIKLLAKRTSGRNR
jgi:hypothetical protein